MIILPCKSSCNHPQRGWAKSSQHYWVSLTKQWLLQMTLKNGFWSKLLCLQGAATVVCKSKDSTRTTSWLWKVFFHLWPCHHLVIDLQLCFFAPWPPDWDYYFPSLVLFHHGDSADFPATKCEVCFMTARNYIWNQADAWVLRLVSRLKIPGQWAGISTFYTHFTLIVR